MTLRLGLRLFSLFSATLIVALGVALFVGIQQVGDATERGRLAAEISRGVSNQRFLTSDYLLHQEERARTQWNANNNSLSALLARAEVVFGRPHDQEVVAALRERHGSGRQVFSDLLVAADARGSAPDNPTASALGERLTAQLLLISQEMIADASQLAKGSRDDIASTQREVGLILGGFLVAATATIATGLLLFTRRVLDPIRKLEEGTRLIGAGDWGHHVDTGKRDEIGGLSRAFDAMTAELRTTTVSRDELAEEVTARQRAEEAALAAAAENRFLYSTALVAAHTESFDDALQQCLELVCSYVGWPVGHLYVPAPDEAEGLQPTSVWHLEDAQAFDAFRVLTERTTFRRGEGLPGRVLESGEPAWITDVQEDNNFPRKPAAEEVGLRGAFGFPVKLGEATVAVLEFFTTKVTPADATILDVMPLVGTQIGRVLERERTRAALVEQAEDLEQSNEELEAFSYSVSHDLRAPLRAMDGFSRMLVEDYAPQLPDEAQHYLQVVRDNAKGMGELVDDLLAFSRLGRQQVRKLAVDPRPIVDQVLHELRAEQDGRTVEIDIAELPECQADPALLKEVFANLLSNALKFTRRRDPARIEVGSERRDREVVYFVRDNGAGFDMKYVDKLFGVFQRLHRAEEYEGTGVGLAIVHRIVQRHGGRIWATATVDQGATFSFTIEGGEADG